MCIRDSDVTLSWTVRQSTRSRRGRQGSGQSSRSASPVTTRRSDAGKESSDSGSSENEASGEGSQHSRGHSVPNGEKPKLPMPRVEEDPSDMGARWQRQSVASSEAQRPVQPHPMGTPRMGTSPTRGPRTDSRSVKVRLEQARRRHTVARETTLRSTPRFKPAPSGRRGACGKGGVGGVDESGVGRRTSCPGW